MGKTRPGKPSISVTDKPLRFLSSCLVDPVRNLPERHRVTLTTGIRPSPPQPNAPAPARQAPPADEHRRDRLTQRIQQLLEDIERTQRTASTEDRGMPAARERLRSDAEQIIALTRPLMEHEARPPLTDRAAGESDFSAQVLALLLDIKKARAEGGSKDSENDPEALLASGQYLELLLQLKQARDTHRDPGEAND